MNTFVATRPTLLRFWYSSQIKRESDFIYSFPHPQAGYVLGDAQEIVDFPSLGMVRDSCWFEILLIPALLKDDKHWLEGRDTWLRQPTPAHELSAKTADVQVVWQCKRAAIFAPPQRSREAIEVVIDFTYFEKELGKIEKKITDAWLSVEADTPLAYDVSGSTLRQDTAIGERAREVLQRRISLARIEPNLYRLPNRFSSTACRLGEGLREAALFEERAEIADGQIEAQEYVYEMVSQRLGEFRYARKGLILEVAIVVLLAAEVVIMLIHKSLGMF